MPTVVSTLPRYITLMALDERSYLTLEVRDGVPFLTFTAKEKTRLATHEVVYKTDARNVVVMTLRSANRRFWRRNDRGWIVADREEIPDPDTDKQCYFRAFDDLAPNGMVFESVVDGRYVKRYTTSDVRHGYAAVAVSVDRFCAVSVHGAQDYAVTLPRHVMLYGDNAMYVGDHRERNTDWLKFNKDTRRLAAAHEVIPLLDGNVMIRNININKFWRRSPNWIWADSDRSSALQNKDCHFDVLQLSSTLVAFKSIANDRFLRRYTEYWEDMLCAIGDGINDPSVRLVLSEASISRSLSNINYLINLAQVTEITPLIVGSNSVRNETRSPVNMEVKVAVTRKVTTSSKWSTSSTFSGALKVGFTAGVPQVASVNGEITLSASRSMSTEMGATIEESVQFQTVYKVTVPPSMKVTVAVQCTTGKCLVPFTYTSRDTRVDGVALPPVEEVDGVFEGVSAFDIKAVVTEEPLTANTTTTTYTLPVSFTRVGLAA